MWLLLGLLLEGRPLFQIQYLTSRYLDDLLNIDNIYRTYPAELQLNKAYASNTEAAFLDLNLSIQNNTVSTKIYDFEFSVP